MKIKKKVPKFKNEEEERKFWKRNDSAEYVDWSKAKRISFPKLKPSVRSISLRLPESMLNDLRTIANKKDVPYQSLLKLFLSEKIKEELH
jgi:predicted DNA binding CopG/RHH family protein